MNSLLKKDYIIIFFIAFFLFPVLPVIAQNCDVDFPGIALRNFSSSCGVSADNLTLGKSTYMGAGDVFTFDAPSTINISGSVKVDASGSGKIVIPVGVTVNVSGNFQLDPKSSGCDSGNPCTFEIEINGYLRISSNFQNNLKNLVLSGTGTVVFDDDFENSSNGCMRCGTGGCPNFQVTPAKCKDKGPGCSGGDFCTTIAACATDVIKPIISGCPANISVAGNASCQAVVNWTAPTATDNCTVSSFTSSHNSGIAFPVGTTTVVTYTARDAAGNTSTCSFNVTVTDNIAPVISGCPANISVAGNASCQAVVNWTAPTFTDCSGGNLTTNRTPGSTFGAGTTLVTYTATDGVGNTSTCSFNVTVTDNTAPIISNCPTNISAAANASCQAVVNWTAPTFTDCSGGNLTTNRTPGSTFSAGTTLVTYTATDGVGNTSTCSFNVTVTDNTAPVISNCPTNISVAANASCQAVVNWTPPTFTDNCAGGNITTTRAPGSTFGKGTTTVTYKATDNVGNETTCSFTVTVVDNIAPVISGCPTNITVNANASCEAVVNWTAPTFTDNCAGGNITTTRAPGSTFGKGPTTVTYTAKDAANNTSTCSFTVTVVDNIAPVISGCPTNITVNANASCEAVVNWTAPTFTDNCAGGNITTTRAPGSTFGKGTTTVTYTAKDAANNTSTCSFTVTVVDNIAPVISGCPANITVNASGASQANVNWVAPNFSDNCTGGSMTSTKAPGSAFNVGATTVVTYTATDAAGNTTSCSFNVTVLDNGAPVLSGCPTDIVLAADASCDRVATWTAPIPVSNGSSVTMTSSHSPGYNFSLGSTVVTYTATDNEGRTAICQFKVIVKNEIPPAILNCPSDITLEANELGVAIADWNEPSSVARCGAVTIFRSHQPNDVFALGTTPVEYKATDENGNDAYCYFKVIVTPPEIKIDISKLITPDGDGINDIWILRNIEQFKDNKVMVIDRWGGLIFEQSGYDNQNIVWHGTNRSGGRVPTGTYFYTITVNLGATKIEKKGFLELVR